MSESFRFVARRAARALPPTLTIAVRPSDELAAALRTAKSAPDPINAARSAAKAARAAAKPGSSGPPGARTPLTEMRARLGGRGVVSRADAAAAVKAAFGLDAAKVTAGDAFLRERARAADVLVIAALLADDGPSSAADAADVLRWARVVEVTAEGDGADVDVGAITRAPLVLPDLSVARPPRTSPPASPRPAGTGTDELRALRARREALKEAHVAMLALSADDFSVDDHEVRGKRGATDRAAVPSSVGTEGGNQAPAPGRPPSPRLTAAAVAALPGPVRATLAGLAVDALTSPLPGAVRRLGHELGIVTRRLAALEPPAAGGRVRAGSGWFRPTAPHSAGTAGAAAPSVPPTPPGPPVPAFRASVGDLLVVRHRLVRYEPGEIAHVENVLARETKERLHRRLVRTEDTLVTETESRREEERDLQTTERLELATEANEVLRRDLRLDAEASMSARYGPAVDVDVSASATSQSSSERSDRTSSSFARDVTERALRRVSERRRTERTTRRVEAVLERNHHRIDNQGGERTLLGVYQWLDRVVESRVVRYGRRLLFDVVVPEPAAVILHALTRRVVDDPDLVEPPPFELDALDLDEWNYASLAQRYGATGIEPPPEPYVTVARAFEGVGDTATGESTKSAELLIPEGYAAMTGAAVVTLVHGVGAQSHGVDVVVGRNGLRFDADDSWLRTFPMAHETGALAIGLKTFRIRVYTVVVQVACARTDRALDAWRLRTHQAIAEAHRERVREYEERRARVGMLAQQEARGRSEEANDRTIRAELRRGTIAVLTGEQFDGPTGLVPGSTGLPDPDPATVGTFARRVRFLEQAFEWTQLQATFQPYFWSAKPRWLDKVFLDDVDPRYGEFLRAGAARVVVSVRPGFEAAVTQFLETGEVWEGGELPDMASPLYVPLLQEVREANDVPGLEVAAGEPWETRVPTTLVVAREEGGLPQWPPPPTGTP